MSVIYTSRIIQLSMTYVKDNVTNLPIKNNIY